MEIARETAKAYQAFADGDFAQAAERAQRVLHHSPDDPGALTLVGRLALISAEPDVAHDIFEKILARHPEKPASWLDLATALRDLGRHEDAAQAVQRALALDAADSSAWIKLGEIRLSLNEREEARVAFRRALTLAPASVAAYRGLCLVEDVELESDIVRQMKALFRSSRPKPREAAELHYALAQVYRRAGRRAEFIEHLFAANATQRALSRDGRAEYGATFDRLESAFTSEAFARAPRADVLEPTPFFILGMPRSGTTLVEQLLAAHPEVSAGGELNYMRGPVRRAVERETGRPFPEAFDTIAAERMNEMTRAYARRLTQVGKGSPYVTDKTPGNFHLLGLLRVLFPHAKIVHVVRDPMDTCFSILQYPFDDRSPHTCDMELLAYAYARYVRLMQRWHELFGGEIISVEYERLVESPEAEARRVFEHCALEWDDSYLEFHRRGAAVRTFSSAQVRRPIYRTSVGAWREFSDALAPLERALESELGLCARRPLARMLET